jgi:phage tail protein X
MVIYTTKKDDVLDWICWKHYGTTAVLEQVLAANPTLTEERLPPSIVVNLPFIGSIHKNRKEIRLWD